MRRVLLSGLLLLLSFPLSLRAFEDKGRECFIFINSSIPEQLSLFNEFNHEFFLSRKLQGQGKVTFINIGQIPVANSFITPIINDSQGIWVRKFKPQSLPALYSVSHQKALARVIFTTGEIRQCLQGK
ncbi:hypothetical protein [Tatumella ptyseos]|uniref:hypothetical protein n=1 Tax=Tatumella ptyseos TaxID=82987 RepID=UPI0026EBE7B8|nr:hypothetical protein [Tatumella ptyseos]WKX27271.1 hypothetical protein QJR74_03760 [Tatumella ptyseos]